MAARQWRFARIRIGQTRRSGAGPDMAERRGEDTGSMGSTSCDVRGIHTDKNKVKSFMPSRTYIHTRGWGSSSHPIPASRFKCDLAWVLTDARCARCALSASRPACLLAATPTRRRRQRYRDRQNLTFSTRYRYIWIHIQGEVSGDAHCVECVSA
jgi:hypothetical protein